MKTDETIFYLCFKSHFHRLQDFSLQLPVSYQMIQKVVTNHMPSKCVGSSPLCQVISFIVLVPWCEWVNTICTGSKKWQIHIDCPEMMCNAEPSQRLCWPHLLQFSVQGDKLPSVNTVKKNTHTLPQSELEEHDTIKQHPEMSAFPNCWAQAEARQAVSEGPSRDEWCALFIRGGWVTEQTHPV